MSLKESKGMFSDHGCEFSKGGVGGAWDYVVESNVEKLEFYLSVKMINQHENI